jgi:L-amino acid N-acyltransferase YncA
VKIEMKYSLEPMAERHREHVIDIFNYYVENGFAAFPETRVGYDFYDRFLGMAKGYPALVVTTETGEVAGFGFLHRYSYASAFKRTAALTYFILPQHTRKGLGKTILDNLTEQAREMGIDRLLANISSLNQESLGFHRKFGFQECGRFSGIGRKFGKDFDVIWMIKHI